MRRCQSTVGLTFFSVLFSAIGVAQARPAAQTLERRVLLAPKNFWCLAAAGPREYPQLRRLWLPPGDQATDPRYQNLLGASFALAELEINCRNQKKSFGGPPVRKASEPDENFRAAARPKPCRDEIFSDGHADAQTEPDFFSYIPKKGFPLRPHLSCVRDQGERGTCTAHAIVGVAEAAANQHFGVHVDLSEQNLYMHAKLSMRTAVADIYDHFSDGGVMSEILPEMERLNYVFVPEFLHPYNSSRYRMTHLDRTYSHSCDHYAGPCSDTNHQAPVAKDCLLPTDLGCAVFMPEIKRSEDPRIPLVEAAGDADKNNAWPVRETSLAPMKSALQAGQSFIISLFIEAGFKEKKIFREAPPPLGTFFGVHVFQLVGFIDNADLPVESGMEPGPGGGYFIIKNSWGTEAHDQGYLLMAYDYLIKTANGIYTQSYHFRDETASADELKI